ncbi:MAG TPA: GIY-YIG nuclease family protein [Longimicrobium sp.]|jgi:putative endonuclease|nr:GIY-YIG nuclease family protein [Longimicrobium sp.]
MTAGNYYVYVLASLSRTLYIGVTNDLARRMYEHRHKMTRGFTAQYHIHRLVYFEHTTDVNAAMKREKQIKKWSRKKKAELIESVNAAWLDLSEELFPDLPKVVGQGSGATQALPLGE